MRNLTVILAVTLMILSCWLAYTYHKTARQAENELNQERYNRMIAEEGLEKSLGELEGIRTELSRTEDKVKNIERLLGETKDMNKDLKVRLDKASQIQKELEERIKGPHSVSGETSALMPAGGN